MLAQDEARTLRHSYIGTEHLLLGLCGVHGAVASTVLEALGVTAERVRGKVVRIVGGAEEISEGQIPFTPRSKRVMERALREALSMGHNHIGPEHLLLALVREDEGVAMRILLDFNADQDLIRGRIVEMLGFTSTGVPRAAVPGPVRLGWQHVERRRPVLDWERANVLWRPEGLELRIPLNLEEGALAWFAADEVWTQEPLASMRREIWNGWLALASPTLIEETDPTQLRRMLDTAAKRAGDVRGREQGRVEDFLRRLRDQPPVQD